MCALVGNLDCTSNLHPAIFEIFCSHLQNTELRSGSEGDKRLQIFFVIYSIVGLRALMEKAESPSKNAEYEELLKRTWHGMFFWLQRLGETELADIVEQGPIAFPSLLRNAFDMFVSRKVLKGLLESEEVIAFVTRLWLQDYPSATSEDILLVAERLVLKTLLNRRAIRLRCDNVCDSKQNSPTLTYLNVAYLSEDWTQRGVQNLRFMLSSYLLLNPMSKIIMEPLWPQRTLPSPRQISIPLSQFGFCSRKFYSIYFHRYHNPHSIRPQIYQRASYH